MQHMTRTVTVEKRGANHTLHLVLTICTAGVWAITGWPIAAMMGRKTKTITHAPPPQQFAAQHWQPQQPWQQPQPPQHWQPPYPQQQPPQGWQPPQ